MEDLLVGIGEVLFFALIACIAVAGLVTGGRLAPCFGLNKRTADLAMHLCVVLLLPLFQFLFLAAPHPWGSQIRNSVEFAIGSTVFIGLLEVRALVESVHAYFRWRRSR